MKKISKKTSLIILGLIIGAAGSIFAANFNTDWIGPGKVITSTGLYENLYYLNNTKVDKPNCTIDQVLAWDGDKVICKGITTGTNKVLPNCQANQILKYNGNAWTCSALSGGGGGSDLWEEGTDGVHLKSRKDRLYIRDRLDFALSDSNGPKGSISYRNHYGTNKMFLNGSLSIYDGNLDVNNKIKMLNQTVDADPANTVVTKGYLDSKLGGGGNLGGGTSTPPVCTGVKFLQWNGSAWICTAPQAKKGDVVAGCSAMVGGAQSTSICWGGASKRNALRAASCPGGSSLRRMENPADISGTGSPFSFLCIKN